MWVVPFLSLAHSCLQKAGALKMLAQIRELQMCHLYALLQAVCSVLCSKDALEEKECCCAMDGLILDVAYGELFSLRF